MTHLDRLIELAFDEDLGPAGDITTEALVPRQTQGVGYLWAKEVLVLAGLDAYARSFTFLDASVKVSWLHPEGSEVVTGACLGTVEGPLRSLLTAERVALNLIQRSCGIATLSRQATAALKGSRTRLLDTRKTSPGMRGVSKHAVRVGGASNHRFGLFDGMLIKDNHIAASGGSIRAAIELARSQASHLMKIEIEVTDLRELDEAVDAGADVIMLDNMDDLTLLEAIRRVRGRVPLEVSGNVTLERLPRLGKLGVDFVSMGALTHSARAMDLSLKVQMLNHQS